MQTKPVAGSGSEEREHDRQKYRHGFRPGRSAVEHVAGEDGPWDHRRNEHERRPRYCCADQIQRIHRSAIEPRHEHASSLPRTDVATDVRYVAAHILTLRPEYAC